jgi:hypothetical protein
MPAAEQKITLQHVPAWACRPFYDKNHDLPPSFLMPFFVVSAPVMSFTPVIVSATPVMSSISPKTSSKGYKHHHYYHRQHSDSLHRLSFLCVPSGMRIT